MRALIALLCWLALSGPLALLVSRLIGTTGGDDGVGDEAERWLRSLAPARHRLRDAVLRSALAVIVLAPVVVGGAVAVWRLPDAVTVAQADGQLALAWPPGQADETTTTSTTAPAEAAASTPGTGAGTSAPPVGAEPWATATAEQAVPDAPASPPDAGGGETGAPAIVADEEPAPEPEPECDEDSSGEGSREERCEGDDDKGDDGGSSGPGGGDDGDNGDDAGEPTTTTTTAEPPPADEDPEEPIPYRSSTALLTGTR